MAEAERLDVRAMGPLILSELLFNENIRDQIKKYKRHFLRVSIYSLTISAKDSQSNFPQFLDINWYFQAF